MCSLVRSLKTDSNLPLRIKKREVPCRRDTASFRIRLTVWLLMHLHGSGPTKAPKKGIWGMHTRMQLSGAECHLHRVDLGVNGPGHWSHAGGESRQIRQHRRHHQPCHLQPSLPLM